MAFLAGTFLATRLVRLTGFSATGNLTSGIKLSDSGRYPVPSVGKASHVSPGPVCFSCNWVGKTSNARPLGTVTSFLSLVMSSRNRIFMGLFSALLSPHQY